MVAYEFAGRLRGKAFPRTGEPRPPGGTSAPFSRGFTALCLLALCLLLKPAFAASRGERLEFTPSDVFTQVEVIEQEMELLRSHFGAPKAPEAIPLQAELKPRHSWQLTYEILFKINLFRERHGLPAITAHSLAPVLELDPGLVYEQTQRVLTEVRILRARLGVAGEIGPPEVASGKRPIDAINRLRWISAEWDRLNGEAPTPWMLFAEGMRIYQDIGFLLGAKGLEDRSFPPEKAANAGAEETLAALRDLLAEIQRLQRGSGIPIVDLEPLVGKGDQEPAGLLTLTGMVLAELQPIKARMGLTHALTPPAASYGEKGLGDVVQLLQWSTRRLRAIRDL